jgi:hypothetical protein
VSSPAPEISAHVNTNCRSGPSTQYKITGYLLVGAVSYIYGRDYASMWWYIQNPNNKDGYCWVWSESTQVSGDASGVPVVAASEYAEKTNSNWFTAQYYGYGDGYYENGVWCQPYYIGGKVYCYPNPTYCDPNNWWSCYNLLNTCKCTNPCKCKINWANICGNTKYNWPNKCNPKNVCPLPTGNYANYCKKYPNCCGAN